MLERKRLPLELCLIAMLLASPCLFIGFYLDDYVGRYIYSDLPGASELYRVYVGGYGIANGNPADNLWQVEQGHAPWWIYPNLILQAFRPVSLATHLLDAQLWLNSAVFWHAHSLLWLGALVYAAAQLYRGILGVTVGGLAAMLLAFDHTHGFVVGFACNRHALVTTTFALLCFGQYRRFRATGSTPAALLAVLLYGVTLLAGELGVALVGYLLAYTLFVDRSPLVRRALAFAPYAVLTVVWRAVYNAHGYGAVGSGVYVDPGREPVRFALTLLERGPVLVLGQFLAPPAEAYSLLGEAGARGMWAMATAFMLLFAVALVPVLSRSRTARMWAVGMLASLVPAASTHPHNRQLLFASIGAMALLAELWEFHRHTPRAGLLLTVSRAVGGAVLFFHLFLSPLASPFTTCSIAATGPMHRALDGALGDVRGRDVVFLTAPDYWLPRLAQLKLRIEQAPLPRRWRALSFGAETVTLHRTGPSTLVVDYAGGILGSPLLELYRDRRLRMAQGERVVLAGLVIEVLAVGADGRVTRAQFSFDEDLDAPRFRFYHWEKQRFVPSGVPRLGERRTLPKAELTLTAE